jgi:hypothetical protein
MFGNLAAFLHGHVFLGVFGETVFVRLPEDARAELMERGGARFEPMKGRLMTEYVASPRPGARSRRRPGRGCSARRRGCAACPPRSPRRANAERAFPACAAWGRLSGPGRASTVPGPTA